MKQWQWLIIGALLLFGLLFLNARRSNSESILDPFLGPFGNLVTEPVEPQVGELPETTDFTNTLTEDALSKGFTEADIIQLREGLAASFDMPVEDIQITIERDSTKQFATGYVNVGEGDRGGIYFAAMADGNWQIAHNGIGIITCLQADRYNFPVGLIPRCYDPEAGVNLDR